MTEEVIFCFSDLVAIFHRYKKWMIGVGLLCASVSFSLMMLKAPKYEATGSFIDSSTKKESSGGLKDLLVSLDAKSDSSKGIMLSKAVIKDVSKKLGLQFCCAEKKRNIFLRVLRRYRDNWYVQTNKSLSDLDQFRFANGSYEKEIPLNLYLRFSDKDSFEVLSSEKKLLAKGRVHVPVKLQDVEFTLVNVPKTYRKKYLYTLSVTPFNFIYGSIKSSITIKADKDDQRMLHISYKDRDRYLAKNIVNTLMESYQQYLITQNEKFAKAQLTYLQKRKEEISEQFDHSLDLYCEFLKKNLSETGFLGLEEQSEILIKPQASFANRLFQNDLEESRLDKWKGQFITDGTFSSEISLVYQEINKLKQDKDALEIALNSKESLDIAAMENHLQQLEQLRGDQQNLVSLINSVEQGKPISKKNAFLTDKPRNLVFLWLDKLQEGSETDSIKKDLVSYLKNYTRVLSLKEKILSERVKHSEKTWQDFEGIDLDSAMGLYVNYNKKLDDVQAELEHFTHVLTQLNDESFDISSLSSVLRDGISQNLLVKAGDCCFKLNDRQNLSEKDIVRIKDDLKLIRTFLKGHIKELRHVKEIQQNIFKDKIHALQMVTLDRVNQKISILNHRVQDFIQARKVDLFQENSLIRTKMEELKGKMVHLPTKWKLEKKLTLDADIAIKMIQSLTTLTESKTISHNLDLINSNTLDFASLPYRAEKKNIIVWLIAAFVLGCFLAFSYKFFLFFQRGFLASLDNLKALQQNALGEVSRQLDDPNLEYIQDSDLETLRNISYFIGTDKPNIVSIIGGKGPDFSHGLATILGKIGKKVLVIDCDFHSNFPSKESTGLLQFIEGKKGKHIKNAGCYDFMESGGKTRFGYEILRSSSFKQLIEQIKEKYDIIILFTRMTAQFVEAKAYLDISDKMIVTFEEETLQNLQPFFNKENIGFVKVLSPILRK